MASWIQRALAVSPRGSQTLSKRAYPFDPGHALGGVGCRLTICTDDHEDGTIAHHPKEVIDWNCSLATNTLGHGHLSIDAAIRDQLFCGGTFGIPHVAEVLVGERLCHLLGYEQVRWASTGSEATEAAIRTARIATGRYVILTHGYHSWFSTFTAAKEYRPGVPDEYANVMWGVDTLADITSIENMDLVAAVILEPAHFSVDELIELMGYTRAHGALVIFDEVVSGFRYHLRGIQGLYGLYPDLSVFGKALTNGTFPVSALLGPRSLMQHAWPASGTYSGHPVGLAAVNAVLDIYEAEPIIERIHAAGAALIEEFNALKLPVTLGGHPARPMWAGPREALDTFLCAVFAEGVLMHPSGLNASAVHGEGDVEETVAACQRAGEALQ